MTNFNWQCPYCGRNQVATDANEHSFTQMIYVGKTDIEKTALHGQAIACLNDDCTKLSLTVSLWEVQRVKDQDHFKKCLETWHLLPPSSAKPQPDYIPAPIREDYEQACRIRDLSPKASATLARRCLQGVIRDFCGITKGTLDAEIRFLRNQIDEGRAPPGVTAESVDAIDHVRSIGNIGAHMEKDINLIVDVDPDEAQALIDIIELLFEEWYVARMQRQARLARVEAMTAEKKLARLGVAPEFSVEPQKPLIEETKT